MTTYSIIITVIAALEFLIIMAFTIAMAIAVSTADFADEDNIQ